MFVDHFLNSNLQIVMVLAGPHTLRYSWFLTCKKLPRSVGKIWKANEMREIYEIFIQLIKMEMVITKIM